MTCHPERSEGSAFHRVSRRLTWERRLTISCASPLLPGFDYRGCRRRKTSGRRRFRRYNVGSVYFIYSLMLGTALVASLPYWLWRMLRTGRYRQGLGERFGSVPPRVRSSAAAGGVWVHAVSVGEVLAIAPLIAELRAQHPARRIFISTTTHTGQKLARDRFGAESVFYFPLDFRFAIAPWLRVVQPELIVLAETEFWPQFLHRAHAAGARIAVVNARISDRSFPRYRRLRPLLARVLRNIDVFLAQCEADAQRLRGIGAAPERVQVVGNLKFEQKAAVTTGFAAALREACAAQSVGPVIVAGSTLAGEEELLLAAFRQIVAQHPRALLLLAPRHPERFDAVAALLSSSGVPFVRRSAFAPATLPGAVLLLDTIGELGALYELATVAFVGGSLVPAGGHNVIEPARAAVPVLVGPHTQNFRDVVAQFGHADALRVVTAATLAPTLLELLAKESVRRELGGRAARVVAENSGATARTLAALNRLLTTGAAAEPTRSAAVNVVSPRV
jgi:3-deoxy-D-manno-octulosonic-acid transferase